MQARTIRALGGGSPKRMAFKRLAENRTNAIIDKIRILGNLANRSAYDYTEDDLRKVFSAIDEQLRETKAKFGGARRRRFRLE